jgi:hypothetical protein
MVCEIGGFIGHPADDTRCRSDSSFARLTLPDASLD